MTISLRPRQKEMTDKAKGALLEHGNTLCVAPTGAGKTIMLSVVIKDHLNDNGKCLVLQHTDEILEQNMTKFAFVDEQRTLSIVNGALKDFSGDVVFSMVQSLQREQTLSLLPKIDLLVIDEAHHSVAPTYELILKRAKENNPSLKVLGMTATPTRADNKALCHVFSNVADQITIEELVASGDLLYPKTYVIASDVQDKIKKSLSSSKNQNDGYEENSEAECFISEIDQSEIVKHWLDKAGGRKTVIFCSRIDHSLATVETFNQVGIKASHIDGTFSRENRKRVLEEFTKGDTQVICNMGVLTEGWDYPPVSCIILLRAFSSHSAIVQMIGRGLRTIDKDIYPDCHKADCIVLDFGLSVTHHGSIESKVDLLPKKKCPACKSWIPSLSTLCPKCGKDLVKKAEEEEARRILRDTKPIQTLSNIDMKEIHLKRELRVEYSKKNEPIKRFMLFSLVDELSWMANGRDASALIKKVGEKTYSADLLVRGSPKPIHKIGTFKQCCRRAVDFLKKYGGDWLPFEDNGWGDREPSEEQLKLLEDYSDTPPQTRRQASAMISYKFYKKQHVKLEENKVEFRIQC